MRTSGNAKAHDSAARKSLGNFRISASLSSLMRRRRHRYAIWVQDVSVYALLIAKCRIIGALNRIRFGQLLASSLSLSILVKLDYK
ncbi:hypothetical protein N7527_003236 [Penicillium freii]|nr:hypothetical protein N7527_003236 [Penicillium freii]